MLALSTVQCYIPGTKRLPVFYSTEQENNTPRHPLPGIYMASSLCLIIFKLLPLFIRHFARYLLYLNVFLAQIYTK